MKQTITVHVAGRSREVEPVDMMPILVSADGGYRYAIWETATHSPGVCGKNVAFVDEDNKTVERLLGVEEIATAIRVTEAAKAASPKSPWIPVVERLPQDDDGAWGSIVSVLVTVQSCSLLTGEPSKPFVTSAAYDIEQRIFDVGGLGAINAVPFESGKPRTTVSHWMPMPVSAKEWKEEAT